MFANISCYKFARLDGLKGLREHLLGFAKARGLKGTILLSTEGINLFIAGPRADVDALVEEIRAIPGLEDLAPKYSDSEHQPFNRMLVRIKKEIIAFGVEGIDPAARTSPKLKAAELKRWLDEGRPVTLLDTRNDYEVRLGTFKDAIPAGIDHFRDFPAAVAKLPEELKEQPVVMFCTGGIRCEKAGPFMEREGYRHIYQLDGGILKYFEEVGGDHYDGECFVFDQRVGVDPALAETDSSQCFHCQTPLTAEEQAHPHFQPPYSCPHCYVPDEQRAAERLAERQVKLQAVANPLPGSVPYDNQRPFNVPGDFDRATLGEALAAAFPHLPQSHWETIVAEGRLVDGKGSPIALDRTVRAGEFFAQLQPATVEPAVNANIRLVHEDEAMVVLSKPAPLPMHPAGRFNRNTLEYLLAQAYHPYRLRPAHRLDANTSGLVVCARTRKHAAHLQPQFARGEVDKVYLARVHGKPSWETTLCKAPIGNAVGPAGNRSVGEGESASREARTLFSIVAYRESDDTTLVEARPITGRTNQIRLHLQSLGHPIVGDPTYGREAITAETAQTLAPDAAPMCLHCQWLEFTHPTTGERVSFEDHAPEWARD